MEKILLFMPLAYSFSMIYAIIKEENILKALLLGLINFITFSITMGIIWSILLFS